MSEQMKIRKSDFPLDTENAEIAGSMVTRTTEFQGEKCVGIFFSPTPVEGVESDFILIDRVFYMDFHTAVAIARQIEKLAYEINGGCN